MKNEIDSDYPQFIKMDLKAKEDYLNFLYDSKTTKLNVEEVESVLTKEGFYDFYQRQENKFCTHTNDEEKQKEIINDIIWTLENIEKVEVREVKEVECEDGFKGILIK